MTIAIEPYYYEEFPYLNEPNKNKDMPFALLFEGKPFIRFADLTHLRRFVDDCKRMIKEQAEWKAIELHLTGCKRCQRTYQGVKLDPCKIGSIYFMNAKRIHEIVITELAKEIEAGRKDEEPISVE
jgi:hypothetical protein